MSKINPKILKKRLKKYEPYRGGKDDSVIRSAKNAEWLMTPHGDYMSLTEIARITGKTKNTLLRMLTYATKNKKVNRKDFIILRHRAHWVRNDYVHIFE